MDGRPTHIDLFSGIGGFALAAQWAGFQTIAFCEIDPYCQKVIAKNFMAHAYGGLQQKRPEFNSEPQENTTNGNPCGGYLSGCDNARIHGDIFNFDGSEYRGCDLLTGGFPCQPFSVAGKRRGAADNRHLWPEMLRVIAEARPTWIVGENVTGIVQMELDNVLSDLARIGYAARPFIIPACAVDARHRRARVWIVANAGKRRCGLPKTREIQFSRRTETERGSNPIPDADSDNEFGRIRPLQVGRIGGTRAISGEDPTAGVEWSVEPNVGRVANGIPSRVDRLKGLGNAIVPQVASEILKEIRKLIAHERE